MKEDLLHTEYKFTMKFCPYKCLQASFINNWLVNWATEKRVFCYTWTTPQVYLSSSLFKMINELPIDLNNKQADAFNPFDFIKCMRPSALVGNITRVRWASDLLWIVHNKIHWITLFVKKLILISPWFSTRTYVSTNFLKLFKRERDLWFVFKVSLVFGNVIIARFGVVAVTC